MKRKFTGLFAAWTFFVCFMSLIPGRSLPAPNFFGNVPADKAVHLCFYFVMYILMYLSIMRENMWHHAKPGAIWIVGVCVICFGIGIEFLQSYLTTERYFDIFDILANTLGVLFAWLLVYFKQIK